MTNRRMFLQRFIGGAAVAALGAGTASALVKSPNIGSTTLSAAIPTEENTRIVIDDPGYKGHGIDWWKKPIEWLGDPLNHDKPLSWWAQAHQFTFNDDGSLYSPLEFARSMEFYMGVQWPADVHFKRYNQYRPTLTINMVKGIVDRAIVVSRERGEPTDLTESDWRTVFVNVYRRNRDPQIHYNAWQSARLEMMMIQPENKEVTERIMDAATLQNYFHGKVREMVS